MLSSKQTYANLGLSVSTSFRLLRTAVFYCLLIPSVILFVGCSSQDKQSPEAAPTTTTTALPTSSPATASNQKLKFKRSGGIKAFALKPDVDGVQLVNGNNKELAWFEVDDGPKVKIKNTTDQVIGYIVIKNGIWQVKNADETKNLYILRRQDNGNYQLEDGANREIYEIKAREYGLEIESPNQQSLYQVKVKNGKISLRNASAKMVLYTKSQLTPIAIACFGFDVLSQEQQAALAYAVKLSGDR
jgi:hypothetical protein